MNKKRIAIIGSTGSIGTQALAVIKAHNELFTAEILAAYNNVELLIKQALDFQPNAVVIVNEEKYHLLADALAGQPIKVYAGRQALTQVVAWDSVDLLLSAMVGFAGLEPTLTALEAGKPVALANKETLVAAGEIVIRTALEKRAPLIPVDSEHSAIFQCLLGEQSAIEKIWLTASGGPFWKTPATDMQHVSKQDALKHPNWSMGPKITVDSATMMNKGLEMIEAHWLFDLSAAQIEVVVHPQSIVHSMVQFVDGSVKAQCGLPDMKLPIQYALSFPERLPMNAAKLNFTDAMQWEFMPADREKFPCLQLAYDALARGGNIPCAMNAANEIAVQAFLEDKINFLQIAEIIADSMNAVDYKIKPNLQDLLVTDNNARQIAQQNIARKK